MTVQINVNGISRDVRVPVPFLEERSSAAGEHKTVGDDSSGIFSKHRPELAERQIIKNLFTELEEQVEHHVRSITTSKINHDVNKNHISTADPGSGSSVNVTKSSTGSANSPIELDNVIVIAPDDDQQPPNDVRKETPVIGKSSISVTPASSTVHKTTATSGQMIVVSGMGTSEQYMIMAKKGDQTVLTPLTRLSSSSVGAVSGKSVLKLGTNRTGIFGKDGRLYVPVGPKSGQTSLVKMVIPPTMAAHRPPEAHCIKISNSALLSTTKTSVNTEVISVTSAHTPLPCQSSSVASAFSGRKADVISVSAGNESGNKGSVDDLRISSVCSLSTMPVTPPLVKDLNTRPANKGSDNDEAPGKGLLDVIMNDLKKPVSKTDIIRVDCRSSRKRRCIMKRDETSKVTSKKPRAWFKKSKGKSDQDRADHGITDIKQEWLNGFKEDPVLRVAVEKLNLGPRFKTCNIYRLQQFLAYRRRQKKGEIQRNASDQMNTAKRRHDVKREEISKASSNETDLGDTKTIVPGRLVLIKTSTGSYILPMVPGLTLDGLVSSLKNGTMKLPPVTRQQPTFSNMDFHSGKTPSNPTQADNGKNSILLLPCAEQSMPNNVDLSLVKTESLDSGLTARAWQQLSSSGSPVSFNPFLPAPQSAGIVISKALSGLPPASSDSDDPAAVSAGKLSSLLKRPGKSGLPFVPKKKSKRCENQKSVIEIEDDEGSGELKSKSTDEEQADGATSLSSIDRIKLLKEKLREQEAAIERVRKQRQKTAQLLKNID